MEKGQFFSTVVPGRLIYTHQGMRLDLYLTQYIEINSNGIKSPFLQVKYIYHI